MREFDPLPVDHPIVKDGTRCAICHEQLVAGAITTLIPIPHPTDPEEMTLVALPAHAQCVREQYA